MMQRAQGNRRKKRRGEGSKEVQLEFFARCASGFEQVLADELRTLRMARVRPLKGGVAFFGELGDGYRACLWSRVATRVQLVLARVPAAHANALYQAVYELPWEQHVPVGATIAVDAHGENAQLRNSKFTALKVKDALCDRLRQERGERPSVDAHTPDLAIDVALHEQKATIYLNLSGASLHRRGYREDGVQTQAPLKETLAAGILLAAGWPQLAHAGGVLVDPMCGSGTFAIEAALIAADVAPGLLRERWGFEGWLGHNQQLWDFVRKEAEARTTSAVPRARVMAGDLDEHAIAIACDNARRAGVGDLLQLYVDDAANLRRHLHGADTGLLVANPPYGQRLLTQLDLPEVRAALAQAVDVLPKGWTVALVTPDTGIDTALGHAPQQVIECYNGPIPAWVHLYDTGDRRQLAEVTTIAGVQRKVPIADAGSVQFAARLRKMLRERGRWARKAGVTSYRVYDADLPEYAFSVDLYQEMGDGAAGNEQPVRRLAVIEERKRPASVDALRAGRRLADAAAIVSAALDVPSSQVLLRAWQASHEGGAKRPESLLACPVTVHEEGLRYVVDLNARVDLLPLAQRSIRALVREMAEGKRVACLFAVGASYAVAAAAGGAKGVVAQDSSSDRLAALRDVLAANNCADGCRFERSDVRSWLAREASKRAALDLIVMAPPTWLPARDGGGRDWDLQRDHLELLGDASRLLAPGGALVLVWTEGTLRIDRSALDELGLVVEDVSACIVPHDFERARQAPRCYLVRRRQHGQAKR